MNGTDDRYEAELNQGRRHWSSRRRFRVMLACAVLALVVLVAAGEYVISHAEPIMRKRIVETLAARFGAPVELDHVDISLFKGLVVAGSGLRIPLGPGVDSTGASYPLLTVRHFRFRTTMRGLLRQPTHVAHVDVDGMEMHIPPPAQRSRLFGTREGGSPANPERSATRPRMALVVNQLRCREVKVFVESGKPGKLSLEFDIASLRMQDVGPNQAMLYDAELTNPKPVGVIHVTGHFGPWGATTSLNPGEPPDPGQTHLDGSYTFRDADLNTIKGIGGTLSSSGRFTGVLDRITIDGETDTPNFSLDISTRPVPLHTTFHADVDGTSGDTYLQPVHAHLGGSDFTVAGRIVKVARQGHDIQLNVEIPHGRMQDFLRLAIETDPPLMNGTLAMSARLHIPPGDDRVPVKMAMEGVFHLTDVRFNNPAWQDRIDGLSARSQGRPRDVAQVSRDRDAEVHSQLAAHFVMQRGVLQVTDVRYAIPGAVVLLNGVYSMDGRLFEFKGHVRTDATASRMVTGWKSLLLKPVDPFLQRSGAGVQLPITISGTAGNVHLGLALHGTDESPQQMLAEVKAEDRGKRNLEAARREAALADAEDLKAAKATTLQQAQQAHQAAVRHRAEAQRRAMDAQRSSAPPDR